MQDFVERVELCRRREGAVEKEGRVSNGLHQGQMLGVSIEHLKWEDVEKDKNLLLFRHCAQYRYFHHQGAKCLNVIRPGPVPGGKRDKR